jgi:AraC-like DNA-binding protein
MTIRFFKPRAELADVVAWIYEHESGPAELGDLRWLIVPDGYVKLILPLRGDITCTIGERRSTHRASRLILSGMRTMPGYLGFAEGVHAIGVMIRPEAVYRLIAGGHAEIANRTLDASDVFGKQSVAWQERIVGLARREDRVTGTEDALCARLARSNERDGPFEHAVRTLMREPATVGELAQSLGWSKRKLERRFDDRLGISPKRLASIARFHRTYARLKRDARWCSVADGPYYDQSHFLKDFTAYTGMTLRAYARASDYGKVYIPPEALD